MLDKVSPRATRTSLYLTGLGILIWGTFATLGICSVYACSILAGD